MFTRSALVLAFLASIVLAGLASTAPPSGALGLAASPGPVLLLMAVAAASVLCAERVLQLYNVSGASSFEPALGVPPWRLARLVDRSVGHLGTVDPGVGHLGRVDRSVGHPATVGVHADHAGGTDPVRGIGPAARRHLQTVPPITLAAPPGLR